MIPLQHALSTFLISIFAFTVSVFYPSDQNYWLLLSSILLSQAGLRAELDWQVCWQVGYYLLYAFIAAIVVLILSVASSYFVAVFILLALTTFISNYFGWLRRKFFFTAFFINLLAIIAIFPFNGSSEHMAFHRFYLILLSGLLIFCIRLPFFLYQSPRKAGYAWIIFLQKLKQVYYLIFDVVDEEDEKHFQTAWCDCLSALELFKKITATDQQLENIWDLSLSLAALRYRITDKAVLAMSQNEFKAIAAAVMAILDQYAHNIGSKKTTNSIDFKPLAIAIQRLETLYHNMLQTLTPEPLVWLLFIQDLHLLQESLGKFMPQMSPSQRSKTYLSRLTINRPILPDFFPLYRALRSTTAVLLALILGYYVMPTHCFWIMIVATLLTQTEMGLPFHQTLQRSLSIIVVLLVGTEVLIYLPTDELPALLIMMMTALAYSYACTARRYLSLHFPLLIMVVSLVVVLIPIPTLQAWNFLGVVLGAAIAMISTLVIFPDQTDLEFTRRVLPLLEGLATYLAELGELLLHKKSLPLHDKSRAVLENLWGNRDDYFPVWVFEPGYNPALRAGQYYFVIHLGQATEILFAMSHLARHDFAAEYLAAMTEPIAACMAGTQALFIHLIGLLKGGKLILTQEDYIEDVVALEESFRKSTPISLEFIDLSRDHLCLVGFIRYLKDLRRQLLQLVFTVR